MSKKEGRISATLCLSRRMGPNAQVEGLPSGRSWLGKTGYGATNDAGRLVVLFWVDTCPFCLIFSGSGKPREQFIARVKEEVQEVWGRVEQWSSNFSMHQKHDACWNKFSGLPPSFWFSRTGKDPENVPRSF